MKACIRQVDRYEAVNMLASIDPFMPTSAMDKIIMFAMISSHLYFGWVDNDFVAMWGLIPPTLMSDTAYLWMHVTEKLKGHEFFLVRHSQCVIEEALKKYSIITGHTHSENLKAIRWLKWLGAEFDEGFNGILSFTIKASNG